MWYGWSRPDIVVIGSVLTDTVAERDVEMIAGKPVITIAEGEITTSIGGCAYNIAVNLGLAGISGGVGLFTYLPLGAVTTKLAHNRFQRFGVAQRYVFEKAAIGPIQIETSGGFVGIRDKQTRHLHICTVQEFMGQNDVFADEGEARLLNNAVQNAKAVVADSGLHPSALAHVMHRCSLPQGAPLFVHLVSKSKTVNYWQARKIALQKGGTGASIFAIMGKTDEIETLLRSANWTDAQINEATRIWRGEVDVTSADSAALSERICKDVGATQVLITPSRTRDGQIRWAICANSRGIHRFEGDGNPPPGGSPLGISEAVSSAFIYSCTVQNGFLGKSTRVASFIDPTLAANYALYSKNASDRTHFVLRAMGATPGANYTEREQHIDLPLRVRVRAWGATLWSFIYFGLALLTVIGFVKAWVTGDATPVGDAFELMKQVAKFLGSWKKGS
jgi:hypothetical protein